MRRRGGSGDWQFQLLPRPCRKDEKLQQAETNSREIRVSSVHFSRSHSNLFKKNEGKPLKLVSSLLSFHIISVYSSHFSVPTHPIFGVHKSPGSCARSWLLGRRYSPSGDCGANSLTMVRQAWRRPGVPGG